MAITKARQLAELIANSLVDSDEISVGAVTTSKLADTLDFSSKTMVMADDQLSGDKIHGGTVSAFSSTGIDDNASSTAVTILSSGNVGIGTDNADSKLDVRGNVKLGAGGEYRYLHLVGGIDSITDVSDNNTMIGVADTGFTELTGTNNTGWLVYRARRSTTAGRSGHAFYTGTTNTARLAIDATGNVGIGTTSPNGALHISRSDDARLKLTDTGDSCTFMIRSDGVNTSIGTDTAHPIRFMTNNLERMRITSAGSVLAKNGATDASQFIFNDGWSAEARNIRVWAEEEVSGGIGRWFSFLGTNVSKDGDGTYTKPSDDASSNWGNIAGMLFTGANTAGQNAIDFVVDLPSAHGGGLNESMSGSDLYNKSAMSITANSNVGIGTTSPSNQLEVTGGTDRAVISVTNADLGNLHYTNRQGRYLTSNGAGWTSGIDGADPGIVIGGDNSSGQIKGVGIVLHNDNNSDNQYSPTISFGSKSNSGSYNTTYAHIIGRKTGQAADSNWSAGELGFYTQPENGYVTGVARMKIDSEGRVTKPNQPAFMATKSNGSQIVSGATATKLAFNNTIYDINGDFDTTNNRFYAPVDGRYLMILHVELNSNSVINSSTWFYPGNFYVNGSQKTGNDDWGFSGKYHSHENVIVLDLNTNDYVEVFAYANNNSLEFASHSDAISYTNTRWVGYLLG
jgi:hypothetical protein